MNHRFWAAVAPWTQVPSISTPFETGYFGVDPDLELRVMSMQISVGIVHRWLDSKKGNQADHVKGVSHLQWQGKFLQGYHLGFGLQAFQHLESSSPSRNWYYSHSL